MWQNPYAQTPIQNQQGDEYFKNLLRNNASNGGRVTRPEDSAQIARNMGYSVAGGYAFMPGNKGAGRTPIQYFQNRAGQAGGGTKFDPLLSNALLTDVDKMQGAADRQFGRVNQEIGGLDRFLGGVRGDVMGVADQSGQQLRGYADEMNQLGQGWETDIKGQLGPIQQRTREGVGQFNQGLDRAEAGVDKAMGRVPDFMGDIEEGYKFGDDAVATMKEAVQGYRDMTAEEASVAANAIKAGARNGLAQVPTVDATGMPIPASVQAEMRQNISRDADVQAQTQVTQIYSKFNDSLAGLKNALANVQLQAGSQRLEGAGLKQQGAALELEGAKTKAGIAGQRLEGTKLEADVGMAGVDATLRAQQNRAEMAKIGAGLYEADANIRNAAIFNAVSLEMNGLVQKAQLVMQNPETVVSWFEGMLAMYTAQRTGESSMGFPGASGMSSPKKGEQGPATGVGFNGGGRISDYFKQKTRGGGVNNAGSGAKRKSSGGSLPPTDVSPYSSEYQYSKMPHKRMGHNQSQRPSWA